MLVKMDFRETALQAKVAELLAADMFSMKIESANLPIGDIIICDAAGIEKVIIERKSLADLAASIRDGRYKEQSFRLQNACSLPNHNIFYLIEGDLKSFRGFTGGIGKNALLSAMTSLAYTKGFSVFRTMNLQETAEWLIQLAKKLSKPECVPYYKQETLPPDESVTTETDKEYATVVAHRTKKQNITTENIGAIMLAQIPGVSVAAALVIMEQHKSIAELIKALSNEKEKDETVLGSITLTNKSGQAKKLNKTTLRNIREYLIPLSFSM